MQKQLKPGAKS